MKINSVLFVALLVSGLFTHLNAQDAISIAEARQVDAEGSLMRLGQTVELQGISIGPNFRAGGQTWVLFDPVDNIGITVFAFDNSIGYTVQDGDELRVIGELDEFNGLAEIVPESIEVLSSGNSIPDPMVVSELSEMTEARLIKIENVSLVDESQWGSSNFNVDLTDGTNTFQMRIDGDINIAGMPAPQGVFDVTGVGGQFDNSAPYSSGYQIFPRSSSDIDPYDTGGNTGIQYENLSIPQAREIDLNGNAVRLDDNIAVRGITHGINFRPSGLQFTIIDESNTGIGIFSTSNAFNYEFKPGDELLIKGKLDQFSGLTQISPDSLFVISENNDLVSPDEAVDLNETTESSLVTIQMAGWVDETEWRGDGSSFNIDFMTVNGLVLTIRIDSDTELANSPLPDGLSFVTGIGGQFDSSEPYDEGYQLFPFSSMNFEPYLSVYDNPLSNLKLYPNPVQNLLFAEADETIEELKVYSLDGKLIVESYNSNSVNVSDLLTGQYLIDIKSGDKRSISRFIKE